MTLIIKTLNAACIIIAFNTINFVIINNIAASITVILHTIRIANYMLVFRLFKHFMLAKLLSDVAFVDKFNMSHKISQAIDIDIIKNMGITLFKVKIYN